MLPASSSPLVWYELDFPPDLEVGPVLHFVRGFATRARHGLVMSADPLVFEVSSSGGIITWRVAATPREAEHLLRSLHVAVPGLRGEQTDPLTRGGSVQVWELRLSSHRRPLRSDLPDLVAAGILTALHAAHQGEQVTLQWVVGPWLPRPVVRGATGQNHGKGEPSLADPLQLLDVLSLEHALDSEQVRALRRKHDEPIFGVVGRIAISASSSARIRVLRQGLIGALQLMRTPGVGFERRLVPKVCARRRFEAVSLPLARWPCVLSASELAASLGWPIGNPVLPGISYRGHRQLPPPRDVLVPDNGRDDPERRITGRTDLPGQSGLLTLSIGDALTHTHIIGPSGSGKSTLLANLALQDIAAGRSVVVIDPKGDLVTDIADRIPAGRLDDVVLLDPTAASPVGLNVLKGAPELVTDSVVHIFHSLYAAHWGPRTHDILTNALLTLTRAKGMTLCELPPLLTNAGFRAGVLSRLKTRDDTLGVGPFWAWFNNLSDNEQAVVIGPVLNKVRQFTNRSNVRGVIGQAEGFDLMQLFVSRKVLLINLGRGRLGSESARALGALIMGRLWATVQRRASVEGIKRHPVPVYLDEFQETLRLPLDLADTFAQARGYGVPLVVAHQHLAQLDRDTRGAVLANARTKIVFQTGHEDALVLAHALGGGLKPEDIGRLGPFETFQALGHGGHTRAPASAATLPLPSALGTLVEITRRTAERYGTPRNEVDEQLVARRTIDPSGGNVSPIGSRKRGGKP